MPQIIYDYDPRNLPNEYLQAIGLAVTSASQTESVLQDFIGALLGIDNIQNLAVTNNMAIPLKDEIIRMLVELNAPSVDEIDKIDNLLDDIQEAFKKRNAIVHNSYVIHPETAQVLSHRLKARGSFQLELRPISVKEIKEDAIKIYDVGMKLMEFMISRGLSPSIRLKPLRPPVNRKKSARSKRAEKKN